MAVRDDFRNAGNIRRHHGQACGHRFGQHIRNAVSITVVQNLARQGKDHALLVYVAELFLGDAWLEVHDILEIPGFDHAADGGCHISGDCIARITDQVALKCVALIPKDAAGFD